MTFAELVSEVMLLTRRPDLTDRVQSAVRAATLKAHTSDFYYKDLHEQSVQFVIQAYIQNFLPTDIWANFRKAKYIRIWNGDDVTGYPGPFLPFIQIENSLDSYGCIKTNVFYQAGQLLQCRGEQALDKILFGAYLYPILTPESAFCSWIAKELPWVIIYEAARIVFKSIGRDAESQEMDRLAAEQYAILRMSFVDDAPIT